MTVLTFKRLRRDSALIGAFAVAGLSLSLLGFGLWQGAPTLPAAVTGILLWLLVAHQALLVIDRLRRKGRGAASMTRHRVIGIAAALLFVLHVGKPHTTWTQVLWALFILVLASSVFGRSQVAWKSRRAFMGQYGLHILLGAACLALGFWHGVFALTFE